MLSLIVFFVNQPLMAVKTVPLFSRDFPMGKMGNTNVKWNNRDPSGDVTYLAILWKGTVQKQGIIRAGKETQIKPPDGLDAIDNFASHPRLDMTGRTTEHLMSGGAPAPITNFQSGIATVKISPRGKVQGNSE